MADFTSAVIVDDKQNEAWDKQQRNVFILSREEYKNECNRNTYMGYILNNMGMGPGPTMKTADQV